MFEGKAGAYLSEASIFQVLNSKISFWPYPQTEDYAGKACQRRTFRLITKIYKLRV
jgi:hypothetical protein